MATVLLKKCSLFDQALRHIKRLQLEIHGSITKQINIIYCFRFMIMLHQLHETTQDTLVKTVFCVNNESLDL